MEKMALNIQLFAEEAVVENEVVEAPQQEVVEQQPTFTDLLRNPQYQREFDRLVSKSLDTAKGKWEADYQAKLEAERTEAEKLAKMDATQKMDYELNKQRERADALQKQVDAESLYRTASGIANQRGIPNEYLDLFDFANESADSISAKLDVIGQLRNRDRQMYLNYALRQQAPQQKVRQEQKIDPYIEGFLADF